MAKTLYGRVYILVGRSTAAVSEGLNAKSGHLVIKTGPFVEIEFKDKASGKQPNEPGVKICKKKFKKMKHLLLFPYCNTEILKDQG